MHICLGTCKNTHVTIYAKRFSAERLHSSTRTASQLHWVHSHAHTNTLLLARSTDPTRLTSAHTSVYRITYRIMLTRKQCIAERFLSIKRTLCAGSERTCLPGAASTCFRKFWVTARRLCVQCRCWVFQYCYHYVTCYFLFEVDIEHARNVSSPTFQELLRAWGGQQSCLQQEYRFVLHQVSA